MPTATHAYTVRVPGIQVRSCASMRGAERALGQMMTAVEPGTVGQVEHAGEIVLLAESDLLGWRALAR